MIPLYLSMEVGTTSKQYYQINQLALLLIASGWVVVPMVVSPNML